MAAVCVAKYRYGPARGVSARQRAVLVLYQSEGPCKEATCRSSVMLARPQCVSCHPCEKLPWQHLWSRVPTSARLRISTIGLYHWPAHSQVAVPVDNVRAFSRR